MSRLVQEPELLKIFPMKSRQLRELRYQRKVPYTKVSRTLILYDPAKVAAALERLEVKEVV